MSYWNYRIMKRKYKQGDYEEEYYGIYEVYYNDKEEIKGFTENPIKLEGETKEEIIKTISYVLNALSKDVLDYDELEKKFEYDETEEIHKLEEGLNES